MSRNTAHLSDAVKAYGQTLSLRREPPAMARLRTETAGLPEANMQISVEQGQFMGLLVQLLGVRRAIEVGVFTGYSALAVARHLPADGQLIACDVSDEWTAIGRRHWDEAGVAARIDLRIAPADRTLGALREAGEEGRFDFAFIDADKTGYDAYYEHCLALVRPGGAIAIDNIFFDGTAIDPRPDDADGRAIHAVTTKIFADDRVDPALIPISDGLLLIRKR
ncbi:MAG: class I SAM-dependent methyltransferase [Alphaproteobacteria bacterium]